MEIGLIDGAPAYIFVVEDSGLMADVYPFRSNLTGCDGGGVVFERRH
jgi:hypothetical protein